MQTIGPFQDGQKVISQIYYDFEANSTFLGYFIPHCVGRAAHICVALARNSQQMLDHFNSLMEVIAKYPGNSASVAQSDLIFSRVVYLYFEDELSLQEMAAIQLAYKDQNLSVQLRGPDYETSRWLQKQASRKS